MIQHGLKNKRGEKENFTLRKAQESDCFEIVIMDNGVGMTAETMEAALRFDPNAALGDGHSIGLRNINARVKLLFGTEYGLSIDSHLDKGCVVLRLPKEEQTDA